ncbi:hypothetical protein KR067_004332 [Drosophila pandora]|nr:hypothetical protein KR067_004332 [Drosophila pandora]
MEEDKTREEILESMDLVFVDAILPRCRKGLDTTNRAHYKDHTEEMKRTKSAWRPQTDPSLISGHFTHNLKVSGQQMITRTWPRSMDWREEYNHFVKRNKWCNPEIYKLFFVCPPIRYQDIVNYLKDLLKTTYMSDYSPKEYISLFKQHRVVLGPDDSKDGIDYQTTYGNYHNRIQEENPFKDSLYEEPDAIAKKMSVPEFEKAMRKLFTKYNLTTYYEEICLPALIKAKNGIMPSGPIDRYTLRKH